MERPQVTVIEFQSEETAPANIPSWEAEQLLRKYGHQPEQFTTRQEEIHVQQPGLTFEEMIAQQEAEERNNQLRRQQQMTGPKPMTFSGDRG